MKRLTALIALIFFCAMARAEQVTLKWDPSPSSDVTGYRLYRAEVSGGPYVTITSTAVPCCEFTDSTVEAGKTYFWVATAIDVEGRESLNSNEATHTVPLPDPPPPDPPNPPGNLRIAEQGAHAILDWDEVEGASYFVWRGTSLDRMFKYALVSDNFFAETIPGRRGPVHYAVSSRRDGMESAVNCCVTYWGR